jgi:hypothetical protein
MTLKALHLRSRCTQFTCFTSTEVQILTLKAWHLEEQVCSIYFFTSTEVHILTLKALHLKNRRTQRPRARAAASGYQIYLLYWYRSTYADVC